MDEEMMFEMSAGSLEGLPSVGEMFDLTGKVAVVSGTIGLALSVIYRRGHRPDGGGTSAGDGP